MSEMERDRAMLHAALERAGRPALSGELEVEQLTGGRTGAGVYASGLSSLARAASSVRSGKRNMVAGYEAVRSQPKVSI